MTVQEIFQEIHAEADPILKRASQAEMDSATEMIVSAKKIFVSGMGRSGYMMRAFAMRLMQIGLDAYMVGDTSTPSANEGDLLILGSGSGETESLKCFAAKAHKRGVKVLVLTAHPQSSLGKAADQVVFVDTREEDHKAADGQMLIYETGNRGNRMMLGSCSELCMLLYTEALTMMVFARLGGDETTMMKRHATFE